MTFLPLETTTRLTETPFLTKLVGLVKAALPRPAKIDGVTAARQSALRAEARANVDRLLR